MKRGISIIGDSLIFKKLVIRYLVEDFIEKGYILNSMLPPSIFISNVMKPVKDSVIISDIKRDGFELVDLSDADTFIKYYRLLEKENPKEHIPKSFDIDSTYFKLLGLSDNSDNSYTSIILRFIVDIVTFQPLSDDMIEFVNKYYYLFNKIVNDLLDGSVILSKYYQTVINTNKKHLVAIADILIKSENPNEFMLLYDKRIKCEFV